MILKCSLYAFYIGASADMVVGAAGAMIIGGFAGIVSVLGFIFLSPILYKKIKLDVIKL